MNYEKIEAANLGGCMSDDLHIPDTGPMSFARWNETSGYQFCSCGKWHFVRLETAPSYAAELAELADSKSYNDKLMGAHRALGRPPAHHLLKKEQIGLKLPRWLIDKLTAEPRSRALTIELALREKFGWTQPDVGGRTNE